MAWPWQSLRGYEPLFDTHPVAGSSIEVFYADRLATFGRRGWLVLIASATRCRAGWSSGRPLPYKPFSVLHGYVGDQFGDCKLATLKIASYYSNLPE